MRTRNQRIGEFDLENPSKFRKTQSSGAISAIQSTSQETNDHSYNFSAQNANLNMQTTVQSNSGQNNSGHYLNTGIQQSDGNFLPQQYMSSGSMQGKCLLSFIWFSNGFHFYPLNFLKNK